MGVPIANPPNDPVVDTEQAIAEFKTAAQRAAETDQQATADSRLQPPGPPTAPARYCLTPLVTGFFLEGRPIDCRPSLTPSQDPG